MMDWTLDGLFCQQLGTFDVYCNHDTCQFRVWTMIYKYRDIVSSRIFRRMNLANYIHVPNVDGYGTHRMVWIVQSLVCCYYCWQLDLPWVGHTSL